MIKKLTTCLLLTSSFAALATESDGDKRMGPNDNPRYAELLWDFQEVVDSDAPQRQKVDQVIGITDKMRDLVSTQNKEYNDCMRESNAQQSKDYNRCDKNGGKDKCYDRADKNNNDRRAACERVAHSDNLKDASKRD